MSKGSIQPGQDKVLLSTNDLTGKQYYAVGFDASNRGQIVLANAQTVEAIGILQDEPTAGDYGTVRMAGDSSSYAISGGTVHAGDALTADTTGKLIATTSAGEKVVAYAMEEAVSGDRFEVHPVYAYYN